MSDTKTPPATTPTEVPASQAILEIGRMARLKAVHGYIQHPFTLTSFDTDKSAKVEVDGWVKVQFDAGKLVLTED